MAVSSDVTLAQDGHAKLHPYLVALVRWCVSCVWSTATVFLHRLMTGPLPPITGASYKAKSSKPRPAGRDHLHPEPKVECVVLHQPATHNLDVVFVHGLYGSLGNTWRQGEWRTKYQVTPEKIHLRRPVASPVPCTCHNCKASEENKLNEKLNENNNENKNNNPINDQFYEDSKNDDRNKNNNYQKNVINNYANAFTNMNNKFYENINKILPQDDVFITEKFYNNTLLDQVEIIDNYETQAQFVSDLFKNCDRRCVSDINKDEGNRFNNNKNGNNNEENVDNNVDCKCKVEKQCEAGCGCICDDCYSFCWPKDWIKVDFPDARVISINYTSDPHLWRPLWIKENKRLCLHERAEQMTKQLLDLGVGKRPVVWVGHSKGGLFIKQIYCEAYKSYLKIHPGEKQNENPEQKNETENLVNMDNNNDSIIKGNTNNNCNGNKNEQNRLNNNYENGNNKIDNWEKDEDPTDVKVENNSELKDGGKRLSSNQTEDENRASLWSNSAAFMFYSVPHRGSPLADIKTPITARSVELIEISKDCSLVLSLQERWLSATSSARSPVRVRSLVETRRTLMSVLWLRIVSADSADPGVGALCGVPVDHREICKPTSRRCLLYTELMDLIKAALQR